MIPPFENFQLIRIINLAARADRRAQMLAELDRIGLANDPRVGFFEAISSTSAAPWRATGERGVFMSHLALLREAAASGCSILILEDDADFTDAIGTSEPDKDVSIYYGGYYATAPEAIATSDIIGAHCMGFSAETARALVPFLQALFDHESPPPIDGAYVWFRRANPNVRTEFADPVIAVQRSSRSDIASLRFFDRWPVLREAAAAARRGKRWMQRGHMTFGLKEAVVLALAGIAIAVLTVFSRLATGAPLH